MKQQKGKAGKGVSIFRSIFMPLFAFMILQALIFYFASVYGGIGESLTQNAADILSERLENRKSELQTLFTDRWTRLNELSEGLDALYRTYEAEGGKAPLAGDSKRQIAFLKDAAGALIDTLRRNETNGIFVVLNDDGERRAFTGTQSLYGLCIRDMDPDSIYVGTEDLLLERGPSSIVDALGCQLDSWWESKYVFSTPEQGDYFYQPLEAAWDNPDADGDDLAYFSGVHNLSASDPAVVCYSIPLIDDDGYPYGVLGVEITTRRLGSLLPSRELNDPDKSCYVLALRQEGSDLCVPIVGSGAMYSRCFASNEAISCAQGSAYGGFTVTGRGAIELYGDSAQLEIFNNNNPFEDRACVLMALVESQTLFEYVGRVKTTLMVVALLTLLLGVVGIAVVSRRFAAPITDLAARVRGVRAQKDFQLGRIGVREIDQLVDAIEELNENVSKNIARTDFFSRMSHDMRTPMNAIISFSSPALLEGADEAVKDDYLSKIHDSGELLLSLINEVLDMTKIESNKIELRPEPISTERLCEAVSPIISELAKKKNVRFAWNVAADSGVFVMADKQHINQIVMNLLSNAVKFTPEDGGVTLSIAAERGADPGKINCRIVVKDTGIGMSEAFQKNLYMPFEQESENRGGTGLGLSIAKKLIDLMDGTIQCQSRQNEGTTFIVNLPLSRCDPPAAYADSAAPLADRRALAGKVILICEDNAINTVIIERLLMSRGIITQAAVDGEKGVQAFAGAYPGAFDAILMDIRMPIMDGLTATRRIRALPRWDAASVPIIAMTANAFEEDMQASKDAGMNAHLSKPVDSELLFRTLERLILRNDGENRSKEKRHEDEHC